jgi:hypothetical protein
MRRLNMANIHGKDYAINVLTPMRRWKTYLLKAAFILFTIRAMQWELRRLSFIHFARWTVIHPKQFPRFPAQDKSEQLKYSYLLFESNFNGSWNEYIDSVHSVLAFKLNLVWLGSEKFPGSVPLVPFKKYIKANQIHNDYYYMAYPGSTVSDVKNAAIVSREFDVLASQVGSSDEEFFRAYIAFLGKAQNKLGSNGHRGPAMR